MTRYVVRWEIDADAETPREAAEYALKVQRNPESVATVFEVFEAKAQPWSTPVRVDLTEGESGS